MEGLPFIPGNTFKDITQQRFHRSQTLGYQNGYAMKARPEVGIGGTAIPFNQLNESDLDALANYQPTLTYGQMKQAPPEDFIPGHVGWDKRVLKFSAWFKQTVHESADEHYRVRKVEIYYYLEDDSIAVVEPHIENSGIPQGQLIKRQRLPKNDVGDHWHWKDLNNGINVTFYGKVFHVYDCDLWTQNFLTSEGVVVSASEPCPSDPYGDRRTKAAELRTYTTASDFDRLRQFLEMDRKVLRFYCVWDDRDTMFGELRKFILHYYLVDDTLEVREVSRPNDGRDPFPVLVTRHRVPRDPGSVPSTFPRSVLELTEQEVAHYLTPADFSVGKTVTIYSRRFLVYDVDDFTRAFYWKNFGTTDFTPIDVEAKKPPVPKMEIAPYNGFSSLEDSMQNSLTLIRKPPKRDYIKMLENDHKILRYEAVMNTPRVEDQGRRFIISYHLSNDMITIHEPPVRNSGVIGGKFLERTRVAKPNSSPNNPVYYGPADFHVGAVIDVFRHQFLITNADEYVLKYMQEHSNQFSADAIAALAAKIGESPAATDAMAATTSSGVKRTYAPQELDELVEEVKSQLKKLAITSNSRKDRVFLGVNADHRGFINKADLRHLVLQHHLPADDDIINALAARIAVDPERITLDEWRHFFESERDLITGQQPLPDYRGCPPPRGRAPGRLPSAPVTPPPARSASPNHCLTNGATGGDPTPVC